MNKITYYVFVMLVAFGSGFFFGGKTFSKPNDTTLPTAKEIRQPGYHYTNPLLDCELPQTPENNEIISSIRDKVNNSINTKLNNHDVQEIAYYFRDLNNGPWFGINEESVFTPASLLKTPMMITYLKLAETDPEVLEQMILFDTAQQLDPTIPGLPSLSPQSTYSVEDLLERMIIYSDNNAFNLLTLNINYDLVKKIHDDLGVPLPEENTPEDFLTIKEYAGIFRILYNSSYLNRESSEKALKILSGAAYHDGLVAGIDEGIEVAHKFGIRQGNNGINQLHDCGIVYYKDHPYLICIMTKGKDFSSLTRALQDLSRITYDEIKSLYPN